MNTTTHQNGASKVRWMPALLTKFNLIGEQRSFSAFSDAFVFIVPALALILLVIFFSFASPVFMTGANLTNLLRQLSVLTVVSCGVTFVILLGSIDLSFGSILALSAVTTTLLSPILGLAAAVVGLLVGLACGAINGALHVFLKIPSFIVTLGTLFIYGGFALIITGGRPIPLGSSALQAVFAGRFIAGVPTVAIWAIVMACVAVFIEKFSILGFRIRAAGDSEKVASLVGTSVIKTKLTVFMLSGFFAGFGAVLLAARTQSADPSMGQSILLQGLAAVLVGGTSLMGGIGGPARTLIGVLVISVLSNGMVLTGVDSFYQQTIKGLVIILAVLVSLNRAELETVK